MAEPHSIPELKPIPGCPGYYASRCGWIWSTWKRVPNPGGGRKNPMFKPDAKPPSRLACCSTRPNASNGYRHVILKENGRQVYSGGIHRLILLAFVGPPPEGRPHAAHENGNPLDNRLENLSWKSIAENQQDRKRHGTDIYLFGENTPLHKLTEEDVRTIRRRYAAGERQWKLGQEYGIHQVTVSEIVTRKIWSHI